MTEWKFESPPNQLDQLLALVRAHPERLIPSIKPAFIEEILRRDHWTMSIAIPTSAMHGNNPTVPTLLDTFKVPATSIWQERLEANRKRIERAIPLVGRVETTVRGADGEDVEKVQGTGWLVRDDVVVTNKHVAGAIEAFVNSGDARLRIDFHEEDGDNQVAGPGAPERSFEYNVLDVVYQAPEKSLDLAFLRIEANATAPGGALELADLPEAGTYICAIGFPAVKDTLLRHEDFERMFGAILGVKRLSPGLIWAVEPGRIVHDCATMGGSSGSLILDLQTGKAVALNYGEDGPRNFAVPASIVRERLDLVP